MYLEMFPPWGQMFRIHQGALLPFVPIGLSPGQWVGSQGSLFGIRSFFFPFLFFPLVAPGRLGLLRFCFHSRWFCRLGLLWQTQSLSVALGLSVWPGLFPRGNWIFQGIVLWWKGVWNRPAETKRGTSFHVHLQLRWYCQGKYGSLSNNECWVIIRDFYLTDAVGAAWYHICEIPVSNTAILIKQTTETDDLKINHSQTELIFYQ